MIVGLAPGSILSAGVVSHFLGLAPDLNWNSIQIPPSQIKDRSFSGLNLDLELLIIDSYLHID
jgi:hypothetical protein